MSTFDRIDLKSLPLFSEPRKSPPPSTELPPKRDYESEHLKQLREQAKREAELCSKAEASGEKLDPRYTSIFQGEELGEETAALFKPLDLQPHDRLSVSWYLDEKTGAERFDCCAISADENRQPSSDARSGWMGRLPEVTQLGYGRASCAATDFSVIVLSTLFGEKVVFDNNESKVAWEYLLLRLQDQANGAYIRSAYKLRGEVPPTPAGFIDHPDYPLKPYQLVAVLGSLHQESCALFMEPSLGKTVCTISRIMNEARKMRLIGKKNGKVRKLPYMCLIVAPKSCRLNWEQEIKRFATTPGQVITLRGGQLDRLKMLDEAITPLDETVEWSVVICSYDVVKRSWAAFKMIPWDLGVLDESQYIKGWYAERAGIFHKLRERMRQRMILTGTPIGNTVLDIWSQFEFLGAGLSGFTGWKAFRSFYCVLERNQDRRGPEKVVGYKNMPMLRERMLRLAAMFTKKEVLPQLPDKTYASREVSMTVQQTEYYMKLQEELLAEIEESGEKREMTVNNMLVKMLRLAQVTSGFVSWDGKVDLEAETKGPREIQALEPNPKMAILREVVEEHRQNEPGNKVLVWACFIQDIRRIKAEFGDECVTLYGAMTDAERDEAVRRFNCDPSVRILVGNPKAGGVGINLRGFEQDVAGESYASLAIYYSQDWSSLTRRQSEDRNHGPNRCRGPVHYVDLMVPSSIDEEIRLRVMQKGIDAMTVQDVKDIMKRVLNWKAVAND